MMMQIVLAIAVTIAGFLPDRILDIARRRLTYLSPMSNFSEVIDSGVLNDLTSGLANDSKKDLKNLLGQSASCANSTDTQQIS
jgi:hypothetical protein